MSYLIHPYNGQREEFSTSAAFGRGVGAFFLGPIYFACKGMWGPAMIWLFVVCPLNLFTFWIAGLVAAFFADDCWKRHLLGKGFVPEQKYRMMVAKGMAV